MTSKVLLLCAVAFTLLAIVAGCDDKKKREFKMKCKGKELTYDDEKTTTAVKECGKALQGRLKEKMKDKMGKMMKNKKEKREAEKGKKHGGGGFGMGMMFKFLDTEFYKCTYKATGVDVDGVLKTDVVEKYVDSHYPDDVKADYKTAMKKCAEGVKDGKFANDDAYSSYGKCQGEAFMKYCMDKKDKKKKKKDN